MSSESPDRRMANLADWPLAERRRVDVVLTDIDDTLTLHGRLPAVAYAAMEELSAAGLKVVPITGRPAGWCDHIARMWPVDGVVGENGAFWFRHDPEKRRLIRRFLVDDATRRTNRGRLDELAGRILAEVPGCALASDQLYREADLAIDFCEDVVALPDAEVARIVALFEAAGCTAKVSSIHVNGWFGRYDKLTMTRLFLAEALGIELDADPRPLRLRRRFAQRPADVRLLPGQRRRGQSAPIPADAHQPAALADHSRGRARLRRAGPATARRSPLNSASRRTLAPAARTSAVWRRDRTWRS